MIYVDCMKNESIVRKKKYYLQVLNLNCDSITVATLPLWPSSLQGHSEGVRGHTAVCR